MSRRGATSAALVLAVLGGGTRCTPPTAPVEVAIPASGGVTQVVESARASGARVPARDFMLDGRSDENASAQAVGYVVFPLDSRADTARQEPFCRAFLASLPPVEALEPVVPPALLMTTYWPLRGVTKAEALAHSTGAAAPDGQDSTGGCAWLVAHYDFAVGHALASAVGRVGVAGPVLVAWQATVEEDRAPAASGAASAARDLLVLDLSDFADEDLPRALKVWRSAVARSPSARGSSIDVALARERFRNLLQRYGEQVVQLVSAIVPNATAAQTPANR